MGCRVSKTAEIEDQWIRGEDRNEDTKYKIVRKGDDKVKLALKRDAERDFQIFLINMILMQIMFFKDYQKDIENFINNSKDKFNDIKDNKEPVGLSKKECDCLLTVVSSYVKFSRDWKTLKDPESLSGLRICLVNNQAEITFSPTEHQYSEVGLTTIPLLGELSKNKGFVKLRYKNLQNSNRNTQEETANPNSTDTPNTNKTEQVQQTETNDPYGTIYEANTFKQVPINTAQNVSYYGHDLIKNSIVSVKEAYEVNDEDDSDEEGKPIEEIKKYLSSTEYMQHFANSYKHFANLLGMTEEEIKATKYFAGKIVTSQIITESNQCIINMLNLKHELGTKINIDILPCLWCWWPENFFRKFMNRDRNIIKIDGKPNFYTFPTKVMLDKLAECKCVLIPRGVLKKQDNSNQTESLNWNINWEMKFVEAESYLESCLSKVQAKCFLLLVVLFKKYIEPETGQHGLLVEHLRHQIFWECENHCLDWNDSRIGMKVLQIIEHLQEKLKKFQINNYFNSQVNMIENIPKKFIYKASCKFQEILDEPLNYFCDALRGLTYSKDFYPMFDFKEFYSILYKKMVQNKITLTNIKRAKKPTEPENLSKRQKKEQKVLKDLQAKREQTERITTSTGETSEDYINFEWEFPSDPNELNFNKPYLYQFFVENFIKLAQQAHNIKDKGLFAKYAQYFCEFLKTWDKHSEYEKPINKLLNVCSLELLQNEEDEKPPLPEKNKLNLRVHIHNENNPSTNSPTRTPRTPGTPKTVVFL